MTMMGVFGLLLVAVSILIAAANASESNQTNQTKQGTSNSSNVSSDSLNEKPFFFNYHITHHAGTALFYLAREAGMIWDGMNAIFNLQKQDFKGIEMDQDTVWEMWTSNVTYVHMNLTGSTYKPLDMWSHGRRQAGMHPLHPLMNHKDKDTTPRYISRRNFAEIESPLLLNNWNAMPFDNPNLRSMIVMKNPLVRAIAGDREKHFKNPAHDIHRKFANMGAYLHKHNNYALRWISGLGGTTMKDKEKMYDVAVERLKRFEHVVIAEVMDESTWFICSEWHWKKCRMSPRREKITHPRLRIANDTYYEDFLNENIYDFKLYDYAISLVKQQMEKAGIKHPLLDQFPVDSREALIADMKKGVQLLENLILYR